MTRQRRTPIACPQCGQPMAKVLDTRAMQGTVRRRRACPSGHTIWTKEVPITSPAAA